MKNTLSLIICQRPSMSVKKYSTRFATLNKTFYISFAIDRKGLTWKIVHKIFGESKSNKAK